MSKASIPSEVVQKLETQIRAMTEAMVRGDAPGVARFYADNGLLTDLKEFRVEGREALDQHWASLPPYQEWQLLILETGGDSDAPHQRLHSIARMNIKGKDYVDEGYCFVVWKKQSNGDYRIHVDIYHPLKFEAQ